MLDRLAVELLHAVAKNPSAVPTLQEDAQDLLGCVGAWLATTDADELPISAQLVASELEPGELAQTLHDLAGHLLVLAEIADAANDREALTVFAPAPFADALDLLRVELEKELSGLAAQAALGVLRKEIGSVLAPARLWGIEHRSRFDFVDPPSDSVVVDCVLVLQRPAGHLRKLAREAALGAVNDNGRTGEGNRDDKSDD